MLPNTVGTLAWTRTVVITWPEIKGVYRLGTNLLEKLNAGLLVVLIGILCFFIYLIYSSATGG